MPLQLSSTPGGGGVAYLSFNQDFTCLAIADFKGIKIYSLDTHNICFSYDVGAVR